MYVQFFFLFFMAGCNPWKCAYHIGRKQGQSLWCCCHRGTTMCPRTLWREAGHGKCESGSDWKKPYKLTSFGVSTFHFSLPLHKRLFEWTSTLLGVDSAFLRGSTPKNPSHWSVWVITPRIRPLVNKTVTSSLFPTEYHWQRGSPNYSIFLSTLPQFLESFFCPGIQIKEKECVSYCEKMGSVPKGYCVNDQKWWNGIGRLLFFPKTCSVGIVRNDFCICFEDEAHSCWDLLSWVMSIRSLSSLS